MPLSLRGVVVHGMCVCLPTDLLPTMAILRCFCCGAMVSVGEGDQPARIKLV